MDFDRENIWNIEDEIVFPLQKHIYHWLADHKKHTRHLITFITLIIHQEKVYS